MSNNFYEASSPFAIFPVHHACQIQLENFQFSKILNAQLHFLTATIFCIVNFQCNGKDLRLEKRKFSSKIAQASLFCSFGLNARICCCSEKIILS